MRRRGHEDRWTFLTNHARVLIFIAGNPRARLRDVAEAIGITERSATGIVRDLEEAGYVRRSRIGRRNRYVIRPGRPFRHPADADHSVDELLALFLDRSRAVAEQEDSTEVAASFAAEPPPEPEE
jgi:DNA-binding IclR family transcriptional regulator